jgi:hypothetical protein
MAARLKLTPVTLSPEREKLREAIGRRDELRERVAGLEAAGTEAMHHAWTLNDDLANAKARIPEAEQLATDNAVERAMQRKPKPGLSPDEARQAVANIEDQIEATARARQHLADQLKTAKADADTAQIYVEAAVRDALWAAPEALRLLRDLETATRTALECRAALEMVGAVPNHLFKFTVINPPTDNARAESWRATKARLMDDPSAPMPS